MLAYLLTLSIAGFPPLTLDRITFQTKDDCEDIGALINMVSPVKLDVTCEQSDILILDLR